MNTFIYCSILFISRIYVHAENVCTCKHMNIGTVHIQWNMHSIHVIYDYDYTLIMIMITRRNMRLRLLRLLSYELQSSLQRININFSKRSSVKRHLSSLNIFPVHWMVVFINIGKPAWTNHRDLTYLCNVKH